jgi:hypothetical protein
MGGLNSLAPLLRRKSIMFDIFQMTLYKPYLVIFACKWQILSSGVSEDTM